MALKSFTFVPVGPGVKSSSTPLNAVQASCCIRCILGLNPFSRILSAVFPSQKAPAFFSEPSIPSVSAARAVIFDSFSMDNAKDSKNSVFLPPRPDLSIISTVVSPPDNITAGL